MVHGRFVGLEQGQEMVSGAREAVLLTFPEDAEPEVLLYQSRDCATSLTLSAR